MKKFGKKIGISLFCYDTIIFLLVGSYLFYVHYEGYIFTNNSLTLRAALAYTVIELFRSLFKIYKQIWRYGGIRCYILLILADAASFVLYYLAGRCFWGEEGFFIFTLAFWSINLLCALTMRMLYRYAYKYGSRNTTMGMLLRFLLKIFAFGMVVTEKNPDSQKIKIAIIGAGSVGVNLAEELWNNPFAQYLPRCFVDINKDKVGRNIHGVSVLSEDEATLETLHEHQIQEVVFAIPNLEYGQKVKLFDYYRSAGFKIKVFDAPTMTTPGRKGQIRDFDIVDLLMRAPKEMLDERTRSYYEGKIVLITGGGGSIGSELCRQLCKMNPKQIIILDVYENCAYDVQQELLFKYKKKIDIRVEIVSITNRIGLARTFERYHPDIVINAAAHKHVPLMESNPIEAVENNVFGTINVIELCEEFGVARYMMLSTDKAVNPTNVMGATKRMCEMIMQAYSLRGKVKCSATRFGNVLGSAGSVIPIFKRQIAEGGPVTVTDRRIIRYFMTIPEASQLVLTSGAIAENGELFVLDMGNPVKIFELAERMVYLSGMEGIEIIETGLRPGEKLYEELLIDLTKLDRTDNNLIFIEKEKPISMEALTDKLTMLKVALAENDEEGVKEALRKVVPTFRRPEEVNKLVG